MLQSGGYPVVAPDDDLARAVHLGREKTGIDVDPTGAAGLAACLTLAREERLQPSASLGFLFTGWHR